MTFVLQGVGILNEQLRLARLSKRVDILTYNADPEVVADFAKLSKIRLVVGLPPEQHSDRQRARALIFGKAISIATRNKQLDMRVLAGLHAKVMIFHLPRRILAILGSQNVGHGSQFELAVTIDSPRTVSQLCFHFESLWLSAHQVKAIDLAAAKSQLLGQSFEVPPEQTLNRS